MTHLLAVTVAVAVSVSAFGLTAIAEQQHHTGTQSQDSTIAPPTSGQIDPSAAVAAAPATVLVPAPLAAGGCMVPMMSMMGSGGMGMMDTMMPMMGQGGQGASARAMSSLGTDGGRAMPSMQPVMAVGVGVDRIEGRIAFLRAEIGVTDAQASAWEEFADSIRSATERIGKADVPASGGSASPTLAQRLAAEDGALSRRLDDVKALQASLAGLYAILTDDQKTTAETLIPEILGAVVFG